MRLYEIFFQFLDWIFPPQEDTIRVQALSRSDVYDLYAPHIVNATWILSSYKNTNVRALLHEAKFHRNMHAVLLLSILFSFFLQTYKKPVDMLIPIPLSSHRMRARGYNQVCEILRGEIGKSIPVQADILIRIKNTKPQTELGRERRLHNITNAFSVTHGELLKDKHILLVDDVITTGATLREAMSILMSYSPASVTCVALAH